MKAKKWLIAVIGAAGLALGQAQAALITTLYNTGVDDGGVVLANDAPDPHWTLVGSSPITGAPLVEDSTGAGSGGYTTLIPPWLADNSTSAWVSPTADPNNSPDGDYIYETTFSLTGLDPTTAQITGRWGSDNWLMDILINGASTGHVPTGGALANWKPFSINSGFVAGTNTLQFVVNNAPVTDRPTNPSGLRVEMTGTAVPEPATLALLGMGLFSLSGFGRLRRRT